MKSSRENSKDGSAPTTTKKQWSEEEDLTLRKLIAAFGNKNWTEIGKRFGVERTGKQCRERWYNHIDPDVKKTEWTLEEDTILLTIQHIKGNQWAKMTKFLPGRTDNGIKNRFNAIFKNRTTPSLVEQQRVLSRFDAAQMKHFNELMRPNLAAAKTVQQKAGAAAKVNKNGSSQAVGTQQDNEIFDMLELSDRDLFLEEPISPDIFSVGQGNNNGDPSHIQDNSSQMDVTDGSQSMDDFNDVNHYVPSDYGEYDPCCPSLTSWSSTICGSGFNRKQKEQNAFAAGDFNGFGSSFMSNMMCAKTEEAEDAWPQGTDNFFDIDMESIFPVADESGICDVETCEDNCEIKMNEEIPFTGVDYSETDGSPQQHPSSQTETEHSKQHRKRGFASMATNFGNQMNSFSSRIGRATGLKRPNDFYAQSSHDRYMQHDRSAMV